MTKSSRDHASRTVFNRPHCGGPVFLHRRRLTTVQGRLDQDEENGMKGKQKFALKRFVAFMKSGAIAGSPLFLTAFAYAGPTPVIQASATSGAAPFTVHVNALNTTLSVGDPLTARYQWDFGDPAGQFNAVDGWNAAHIFDAPGTYSVKLKVTD